MAGISRVDLFLAVAARAATADGLTVYNGAVDGEPPAKTTGGQPDPSGRVAPYAVLFPSPGTPTRDGRDAAGTHQDLDWLLTIHVVAGYVEDLLQAIDNLDGALHDWSPTIEGVGFNGLRPPPGYDPGGARRNTTVDPPRYMIPLQYRLTATRGTTLA